MAALTQAPGATLDAARSATTTLVCPGCGMPHSLERARDFVRAFKGTALACYMLGPAGHDPRLPAHLQVRGCGVVLGVRTDGRWRWGRADLALLEGVEAEAGAA